MEGVELGGREEGGDVEKAPEGAGRREGEMVAKGQEA